MFWKILTIIGLAGMALIMIFAVTASLSGDRAPELDAPAVTAPTDSGGGSKFNFK